MGNPFIEGIFYQSGAVGVPVFYVFCCVFHDVAVFGEGEHFQVVVVVSEGHYFFGGDVKFLKEGLHGRSFVCGGGCEIQPAVTGDGAFEVVLPGFYEGGTVPISDSGFFVDGDFYEFFVYFCEVQDGGDVVFYDVSHSD